MLLFLFTCLSFLRSSPFWTQPRKVDWKPFSETFDKGIAHVLEHFTIPGLAISVVQNGNILSKGYGVSDLETLQAVSEHTLFFTGSTAKAFTAAAVSLLVDDDLNHPHLKWSTPVHSIIPEDFSMIEPWYTAHVTITDMLSHRSGLPRHDWLLLTNLTMEGIVQKIRHLPLSAEIRTQFQYSNIMYATAAHMIESVSGQSLQTFFTERIWEPLIMSETYISLLHAQEAGRHISQGYYLDVQGNLLSTHLVTMDNIRGAGNILSSVNDYARWIRTLLHRGPPFSESAYRNLLAAHAIASAEPVPPFTSPPLYGMGWIIQDYRGERVIQHAGSQYGFGSLVVLLPERDLGFIIMGNNMRGTNAAADIIAYDIIDGVLDTPQHKRFDWGKRADESLRADILTNDTFHQLYPDLPDKLEPHPLNISAYEGTFVHDAYPNLTLSAACEDKPGQKPPERWSGVRLCAFPIELGHHFPGPLLLDMYHVTGTSWALVTTLAGAMSASRVQFRIESERAVSHLGIEAEGALARKGEKIWWWS